MFISLNFTRMAHAGW